MNDHRNRVSAFIAAFLVVGIFLSAAALASPQTAQTYAWEQAPPWMWPLNLIMPSRQTPTKSLKLSSFTLPTPTPTPPHVYRAPTSDPNIPSGHTPVTGPIIGGPIPPAGYYCIDDVDPDMCDDDSSYLVPKGSGGVAGSCDTIISNAHKLVDALPQYELMVGIRDKLKSVVSSGCGSTGPYAAGQYVSTYLVIDAYNLAGFPELSKSNPSHVSPSGLFNFWQSAPAGYEYIPYSPSAISQYASGQKDLTGCVMFLSLGSGSYHIGIVNKLELFSAAGDGVISILQSGTRMYIDRFPVVGWNIRNTSTNQTSTNGVAGFGCHQ